MKAALYLRVSSGDGRQHTENQEPDCMRIVQARELELVEVYREQESAVKHRPEYARMMRDAKRGMFRVLVIWAIDRFGRSLHGNMNDLLELDRIGCQVVSCQESWMDTSSPVRDILICFFSWASQQERLRLISRTKQGLRRARAQGKRLGGPLKFFDLPLAVELAAQGVSEREIAKRVGVNRSTVHRALARRAQGGAGTSSSEPPKVATNTPPEEVP